MSLLPSCFPWDNSEAKVAEMIVKRKRIANIELLHQGKTSAISEGILFISVTLKVAPSLIPNRLVNLENPSDAGIKQAFSKEYCLRMADLCADEGDRLV